jgi:hypothetical protein
MHRCQRESDQSAELDDDQFSSGVFVVATNPLADQIRACDQGRARQRNRLVQDKEWKLAPRDTACDVVTDYGINQRHPEYDDQPSGRRGLPESMVRKALGIDLFGWIGVIHGIDAFSRWCFEAALCPLPERTALSN